MRPGGCTTSATAPSHPGPTAGRRWARHQDAAVARPVLREIGIAAHLDGENGFTYGLPHQQQTEAGRLHEGAITAAWRDVRRTVRGLAG